MTKRERTARAETVINVVARNAGTPALQLVRTYKTADTRHRDRMAYLLDEVGLSRTEIAGIFRWANPTNTLHAIKRVVNRMHTTDEEAGIITQLRREINV